MGKVDKWLIWLILTWLITIIVGQFYMEEGRKLGREEARSELQQRIVLLEQQIKAIKSKRNCE